MLESRNVVLKWNTPRFPTVGEY